MNKWSGVIAVEGRDTVDGRRAEPDALVYELPVPLVALPSLEGLPKQVGNVEKVWRAEGLVHAEGSTELEPGEYDIGISIFQVQWRSEGDCMVVTSGVIGNVTVYPSWPTPSGLAGQKPAWPECRIKVEAS